MRPHLTLTLATTLLLSYAETSLVQIHINELEVENHKVMVADFEEVSRQSGLSQIRFRVLSGGSVSSSMFPIQGVCRLLTARSMAYAAIIPPNGIAQSFDQALAAPDPEQWIRFDVLVDQNLTSLRSRTPDKKLELIGDSDEPSKATFGIRQSNCRMMGWSN